MRSWLLWILLGGIVLLSAAFLWLNFRVAASNTRAERTVATSSIGERLPDAMQNREKVSIVVEGEGLLANALEKVLPTEMRSAGLGEVELLHELAPVVPNPILLVRVEQPDLLWTTFFTTSQLSAQARYTSTGKASFIDDMTAAVDNTDGPSLTLNGDYSVTDRSWGLISRPGYHQLLAEKLAQEMVTALKDAYQP